MDIPLNTPLRVVETIVEGNNLTRADTIERELQALYRANTLQSVADNAVKAAEKLEALGIFDDVALELLPGKHKGEAGLRVAVKEKRVMSLKATTFVEQGEGGVEFSTRACNALGRAESIEVSALVGGSELKGTPRRTQLRCDYNQPRTFGLPAALHISGDSTSHQPVGETAYEDVSYGVAARLLSRNGLSLEWSARQRDILPSRRLDKKDDVAGLYTYAAAPEIISDARPSLKSSFAISYSRDGLLPSAQFPLTGTSTFLRFEISSPKLTGGNVDLCSGVCRIKQSVPLANDVSLVASLECGAVRPLTGNYVHIQDRMFMGGPMFLRGFHPRGAGRRTSDSSSSLGGRNRWQVRVGLEGPPPQFTRLPPAAHAHLFVAAGALSDDASLEALFQKETRISAGFGLAFAISAARLEANIVYAIKAEKTDAVSGRLQFGIGADFL